MSKQETMTIDEARKLAIELPYPPSVNGYWRSFRGRQIISKRGREYRIDVQAAVLMAGAKRQDGRLRVGIELHVPDKRRRDCDNVLKAILDSCTHAGLWNDDEQIDDLRIVRAGYEPPHGKVLLVVEAA